MQLVKITLGTFLIIGILYFTAKFYSLSIGYAPYDHPLLKKQTPWIVLDCKESTCLREANSVPNFFAGLHIRFNQETKTLGVVGFEKAIEDILNENPNLSFLLSVDDNIQEIDLMLEAKVRLLKKTDNIIVTSEFDNVVGSLKRLVPQLIYGTGAGQKARLIMLDSIGLAGFPEVDGDIVLSPITQGKVKLINFSVKNEIERRKKHIIIGPLSTESAVIDAINLNPSGYLVENTNLAKKIVELLGQTR